MTALFYLLVLTTIFTTAIADPELEAFAQSVLRLLNPGDENSKNNAILLQLTNGEQLTYNLLMENRHKSMKMNVSFSGKVDCSFDYDGKIYQTSTTYGGGAAMVVNENENENSKFSEPAEPKPVDEFLNKIHEQNINSQKDLADDEVGVFLLHGAGTGMKMKDRTHRAEAKIKGGFAVGSRTKVHKNF